MLLSSREAFPVRAKGPATYPRRRAAVQFACSRLVARVRTGLKSARRGCTLTRIQRDMPTTPGGVEFDSAVSVSHNSASRESF